MLRGRGIAEAEPLKEWRLTPLDGLFDLVLTGVGKVSAAGGVLSTVDPERHGAVVSVGVAGALPGAGDTGLEIGQAVAAEASVYADEGLETGEAGGGFRTLDEMGFPLAPLVEGRVPADPGIFRWLREAADASGVVATVSTCSGTDERAAAVRDRTQAVAEAMEGAAIGHVLVKRFGGRVRFGELRAISNRTGRREAQGWDLEGALERLARAIRDLGDRGPE